MATAIPSRCPAIDLPIEAATERCAWCMETETTIARQAFRIEALMDENERLRARTAARLAQQVYTELLAVNDLLWEVTQLRHPDPLQAIYEAEQHLGKALRGYQRLHRQVDNRKGS